MKCSRCQHDNRPGAKFCEECAAPLARACVSCGAELSPTAKFCSECAHPTGSSSASADPTTLRFTSPETYTPRHLAERILNSKAALEGERKQVTVLFADLKGSMELLADRDPEESRNILDPVLERMMEAVHRYEGTVNQVMGDGIMALFGAPIAHEDHAVRACYAALRMQEAVKRYAEGVRREDGVTIRIRVGLNSGDVVVRAIGSDLHMDYTAVGQTTHLAARMEQVAEPGTVLLPLATLALCEDFVQVKGLGRMRVRGLTEPVEAYELTGATPVRSRFQAHAARGLTNFVGRASELVQLAEALDLARRGRGQVVAVVGEPGVGKSRLFWECAHSDRTEGCLVLEAASVSYGKATTYLPVIELLHGYFQIEATDDVRKIRETVTGKVFSLDRALQPALAPLLALLDVPVDDNEWTRLDPPQRRQRTLDALKRLLLRESHVQPLVLVFEDLHWIDRETQAVLEGLVDSLPPARVLLLVNYRPEYQHAWGNKTYYRQLRIDALSAASAGELLGTLLGTDSSLDELKRVLISRTEGNPFFLEESVRTLVETNALAGAAGAYRLTTAPGSLQMPATAQAVLAARIDRLEPDDKRLLQAASVIGKDVASRLLHAIADVSDEELRRRLARLQAAEFLYESRLFPELEYTFKHALTHEVTYGGLVQGRRRALHARIVDAIETLHADRLDEHLERLAHHALRGELGQQAVHYLRQAGQKATARSALRDAQAWLEEALTVLKTLPESQTTLEQGCDIRIELKDVLNFLGELDRARDHLREAEVLAKALNDERRRGRVCAAMTNILANLGDLDEAVVSGTRALEIAARLEDSALREFAAHFLAGAHHQRGEFARAVELLSDNLVTLPTDLASEHPGTRRDRRLLFAWDRTFLLLCLAELGRFIEASQYEAEAINLDEATYDASTIGFAYLAAGALHAEKGEWGRAATLFERASAVFLSGNVTLFLTSSVSASARVLAHLGNATEALNRLREGERLIQGFPATSIAGYVYCTLGFACLLLGKLDESQHLARRAVELLSRRLGARANALRLLGDIATHPDRFDADRGEAHYLDALALAEPRGMRPLVAHCHLGLGKLYRRTGRRHDAREHLTTATTMYHEMGMTYWLEEVHRESTELKSDV